MKLQGTAKSREMIKLAVHVSTYNRNLDDMQDAMEEQNVVLKRIYNRLYDLEKQYFRQHQSGKKSKKAPDVEQAPTASRRTGPISILGAVAAAGRHIASKRSGGDDNAAVPAQSSIIMGKRRSIDAITNFIRRSSVSKSMQKDGR